MNKVKIYGADTLERYTDKMLKQGFLGESWRAVEDNQDATIYQIHGAPDAKEDDQLVMTALGGDICNAVGPAAVILLHRPDEVQDRLPELKDALKSAKRKIGLVFFGRWHIDDPFYNLRNAIKAVIPHGFFDFEPIVQTNPIVIGTNTTWGEMRSVKQTLGLIDEVFSIKGSQNLVGYLGGKPKEELKTEKLREATKSCLVDISTFSKATDYSKKRVIFIDHGKRMSAYLGVTFNTQLYYYGKKIRTGESSGSAHSVLSIPVIYEMNGAEKTEQIDVIKIPCGDADDLETADLKSGARKIMASIKTGRYISSLDKNLKQQKKINNRAIARRYIRLFSLLSCQVHN